MILLDTSAVYALADRADPNHERARVSFERALGDDEKFLLHSYVIVESAALLQGRLGLQAALAFLGDVKATGSFERVWIDEAVHDRALARLARLGKRGVSLVDCTSFVLMESRGVREALAFDRDFEDQGFALYA